MKGCLVRSLGSQNLLLKLETILSWTHLFVALSMEPGVPNPHWTTQLQWLISLGMFDIQVFVMSMSRFRVQPRKGHLLESRGSLATLPISLREPSEFEHMSLITHLSRINTLTGQDLFIAMQRNMYPLRNTWKVCCHHPLC